MPQQYNKGFVENIKFTKMSIENKSKQDNISVIKDDKNFADKFTSIQDLAHPQLARNTQCNLNMSTYFCPYQEIIKEDKLFIRNKVKEIFKDFNFNSNQQYDENKQLLYIFGDCRKPLSKVHLFQNHWHWLQVRLRKYVVNQKKKHKQQCITQFKKERTQQKNKTQNMIKRRFKQEDCCPRYDSNLKANRSHENKPQSPRNMIPNTICQTTRLRNLSGNTSPKYGSIQRTGPQTCKNANYFSNENHDWNQFNKVRNNSNNAKIGNNYGDYRRTAFGQSQDKNGSKIKSKFHEEQNATRNIIEQIFKKGQTQRSLTRQFEGQINTKHAKGKSQMRPESSEIDFDNYQAYQQQRYEHQRKGSNLTNNEEFSTIKQQKVQDDSQLQPDTITNFHESNNGDGLFTSPELLEECRRLIQISSKFTQSKNKVNKPTNQSQNIKNKLKQSSNIFQKIEYPQYSSPQFAKQATKFKDMRQMLKHIFAKDWTAYISPLDHQQLVDRCPPQYQSSLSLILTQTQSPTNFLNFLQVFPILKQHLKIKFIFSNIFLLLDVDSKGFVEHSDYEMFMQNFIGSPVEPSILNQLKNKLERFEAAVEQTFRGRSIVPGCFEYLELIEKKQIYELGDLLQMFQFQIELPGNNQPIHDICQ